MAIADLVSELITDILDDSVRAQDDELWTDAQLTRFAKEAIKELCTRASVLNKSTTVSVTTPTAEYSINAYIRQIYSVKLALVDEPLIQSTDEELSATRGKTWKLRTGTPSHYVRQAHKITLFPKPIVNDTITILASHIPATADYEADLLLIDSNYYKTLLYYMAYKAFLLRDADAGQSDKASMYLSLFENEAGIKHTAKYDQFNFNTPLYGSVPIRMC